MLNVLSLRKLSEHKLLAITIGLAAVAALALSFGLAGAHENPGGCDTNALGATLAVSPTGIRVDGDILSYTVIYTNTSGNPCDTTGVDSDLTLPNGSTITVLTDQSIPAGDTITCPGDAECVTAGPYSYTIVHANETGPIAGCPPVPTGAPLPRRVTAYVELDGVLHSLEEDDSANDCKTISTAVKHVPDIVTEVHDPDHNDITNSTTTAGTLVHDNVAVSDPDLFGTPTGNVNFQLFDSNNCNGQLLASTTEALIGGEAESDEVALGPGQYSYLAHYLGNGNFTEATAICEPFDVSKSDSRVITEVHDQGHNDITDGSVKVGTFVHDNATVIGGGTTTSTGDVTFDLIAGSNCDGTIIETEILALDLAGVAESTPTSTLAIGHYGYLVSYEGDENYNSSEGVCEPFNIVDARITISQTGTNEADQEHTFTVFVEKNDGTGWVDAAGVTINSTESGDGAITGGTCGPSGPTDVNGECTVIVNFASAGSSTVDASGTVNVGGVNINVATDGYGAHDISNQKTWVDANITITPDGTNPVNVPHTFTVTVMKDDGLGGGLVAAAGEHVDFTLTDGGGAVAVLDAVNSTCDDAGPNTDVNGQCVIVFTSATAGTTTGNAFVTLTVGGVSLTRDTDPATAGVGAGPGGSGPAVKTWIVPALEGCTPGFWKTHPTEEVWGPAGYESSDLVSSVFSDANPYHNSTLLQALGFSGGSGLNGAKRILLRAAVAGLLNSSHPDIDYPWTTPDLIAAVNAALASNNRATILALAADIDADNNLGCSIDAHGNPIVLLGSALAPFALRRKKEIKLV